MHVPTGGTDTAHPALRGSVTDFGGSLLASEEMVRDHHDAAVRDTVVSFPMQRPVVPGRWADSAPSTGTVVFISLPMERDNLMAAGLPINVAVTILAPKWRMFERTSPWKKVAPISC